MITAPDHPIWKILRLAVICVTLVFMCSFNYKNGFDVKDIGTIVTVLISTGVFDQVKRKITHPTTGDNHGV